MHVPPRSVRGRAVLGSGLAIAAFGLVIGLAAYLFVSQTAWAAATDVLETEVGSVSDQLAEQSAADIDPIDLESPRAGMPVFVQIVDADGAVLFASTTLDATDRVCPGTPPATTSTDRVTLDIAGTHGDFLRQAAQVETGQGVVVVCAITSDQPILRAQEAVLLGLLLALPLLVLGVCAAVWLAVGRALRAVDDMRSQAEAMQSTAAGELRVSPTDDEVERLGRTLNALLARLHQQTKATRMFVADAGHELRNPLSTLRVTLEFGEDSDEETLRTSVREAMTDLGRLEHLVQDLLALARSDAMDAPVDIEDVDLAALVAEVVSVAQRAHPDLVFRHDSVDCPVRGNAGSLHSLAVNLVDNAARHAATTVAVSLGRQAEHAVLRVDDDGVGLRAEDCTRVFDRFVRLDDARNRDEGGSGLGLAIVASVADAHGGTVSATPGPGGHFVVTLPLTRT